MTKYDPTTKDGKCVFCEIAQGATLPLGNAIIYETDLYVAFLDPFPNTPGASVVIPRKHFKSDCLKMPDQDLQEFIVEAKKVAQLLERYYDDVGRVGLVMEGTGINHAHIKLYPMHDTVYLKSGKWKQVLSDVDVFFDRYEGYLSSHGGKQADFDELQRVSQNIQRSSIE